MRRAFIVRSFCKRELERAEKEAGSDSIGACLYKKIIELIDLYTLIDNAKRKKQEPETGTGKYWRPD